MGKVETLLSLTVAIFMKAKYLIIFAFTFLSACSSSEETPDMTKTVEPKAGVLVFTKTNGFRHPSIEDGIALIQSIGQKHQLNVIATDNPSYFHTDSLSKFDVIVFCNTSGNDLLNNSQQQAMEEFIQAGNGFVGIHAATDTYRNGSWPWYNDLVGGIVQSGPNHTANNYPGEMLVNDTEHPITAHLGSTWQKNEEYYYWEKNGGYLFEDNIDLLTVKSTGNESYDAERPITWYKNYDGGRSFYTALGHNRSDYQNDEAFKLLIENGILWAASIL